MTPLASCLVTCIGPDACHVSAAIATVASSDRVHSKGTDCSDSSAINHTLEQNKDPALDSDNENLDIWLRTYQEASARSQDQTGALLLTYQRYAMK